MAFNTGAALMDALVLSIASQESTYGYKFAGRNRRYYSITEKGNERLETYRREWKVYEEKINHVLFGGIGNE